MRAAQTASRGLPCPRHAYAMPPLPSLARPATRQQNGRGKGAGALTSLRGGRFQHRAQQPTSGSWTLAPHENFSPVQPWPMTMVATTAATAATGWADPWVMEKRRETLWPSNCFGVGRRPLPGCHLHLAALDAPATEPSRILFQLTAD